MKKDQTKLDQMKGESPFSVPEGYMEGLTEHIMSQLPEKLRMEAKPISMMDRVRPWLYMAAVFAGLGLFFKTIVGITDTREGASDSLLVRTEISEGGSGISVGEELYDEDLEYLEYIEAQYANYIVAEEMGLAE